jgi:hypothetical protein
MRLQTVLGTLRSRLNAIYCVRREFEIGQYPVVVAIGNDADKSNCEAGLAYAERLAGNQLVPPQADRVASPPRAAPNRLKHTSHRCLGTVLASSMRRARSILQWKVRDQCESHVIYR